jgi:Pyridine nucleotide-disulphide oxidoreductase
MKIQTTIAATRAVPAISMSGPVSARDIRSPRSSKSAYLYTSRDFAAPATASSAGLSVSNAIVVDDRFLTSAEGVYAAGDVCNFLDAFAGTRQRIEHWGHAEHSGRPRSEIWPACLRHIPC